jgi:hypothetical protein
LDVGDEALVRCDARNNSDIGTSAAEHTLEKPDEG